MFSNYGPAHKHQMESQQQQDTVFNSFYHCANLGVYTLEWGSMVCV